MSLGGNYFMDFKKEVSLLLAHSTGIASDTIYSSIEIPPQSSLGDYAFPCFLLSRTLRKSPADIAKEIALDEHIKTDWIQKIEAVGGYVNFYLDRGQLSQIAISNVLRSGSSYGQSDEGVGKTVIVEFSSPNIAKPFHVGHACTTVLGHSLSRIYERLGYKVVRMNHLGDYGTQFGKLITAYRLWGDETALLSSPIQELLRIYVKFHEEEKRNPDLSQEARDNFRRLENGEKEEVALWTSFRELSLKEFSLIYERMGVSFDNYNGESFYSDRIPYVVDMLTKKGLLVESDGAKVVMLDEYQLPPCIILKSDGTTIYASRDIASVLYREETYKFHKNIYVVGSPQALHFRQVFSVLKKAGYSCADDCVHVGFGLVKFADMKFSTREGNIVVLDELLRESVSKTCDIIRSNAEIRNTDFSEEEIQEIAEKVGIGAVVYTFVKSGRERDIIFSWDEMLDFEGDSAPYLIYTYARAKSILRKAEEQGVYPSEPDDDALMQLISEEEYAVVKMISDLPDSVRKAQSSHEPFMIARQTAQIARAFNRFYNNTPILSGVDESRKSARLALCTAVCTSISVGTYLLGIEVVERM
jgi:arginyl-tRNA synthetase